MFAATGFACLFKQPQQQQQMGEVFLVVGQGMHSNPNHVEDFGGGGCKSCIRWQAVYGTSELDWLSGGDGDIVAACSEGQATSDHLC